MQIIQNQTMTNVQKIVFAPYPIETIIPNPKVDFPWKTNIRKAWQIFQIVIRQ